MKLLCKILICLILLPGIVHAADDEKFPASVESMTDTSVTLYTSRPAAQGEFYSASCSPYTGVEDASVFTVHTSITVPNLTKGTQYTCRIYIYPSSSGGQVQGISQDVIFTAGDPGSISYPPAPTPINENQIPTITDVKYAIDTNVPEVGTNITFTATVNEPDNDSYKLKFWVCKYDGSICFNAMNGAKEEWIYGNRFNWTAPSGGNYQVQVTVIDGYHAGEDNPFGDNQYNLNFLVYGQAASTFAITTSEPPAGYEDQVLTAYDFNPFPDTSLNSLAGKAAAELYRRAIIGGFPDGNFKGNQPVNRAEAAKFLLLARFASVNDEPNNGQFRDVLDEQWYTKFVVTAAQKGIIKGYDDGTFKPANTVNTAEFLKMLTKTFDLQENLNHTYTDVQPTDWFAPYAGIAQKYNLFPNNVPQLNPGKNLTRDEVAVAIYQYLEKR